MITQIAFLASNESVQKKAIHWMEPDDRLLVKLVENSPTSSVRVEAVKKLCSPALRQHFMLRATDICVRRANMEKN